MFLRDLRYAIRSLRLSRGFALAAIGSIEEGSSTEGCVFQHFNRWRPGGSHAFREGGCRLGRFNFRLASLAIT
jgi:hypothetical protein